MYTKESHFIGMHMMYNSVRITSPSFFLLAPVVVQEKKNKKILRRQKKKLSKFGALYVGYKLLRYSL